MPPKTRVPVSALVVIALCLLAPSATGQQSEPLTRVTVNEVRIDAVVTDAKGNPVTDLRSEDFQVFQDGKRQSHVQVRYVSETGKAAPRAQVRPLSAKEVERTMVLIVDDANMTIGSFVRSRRAIQRYLDQAMRPGDVVAILATSHSSDFFDQFTSDPARLRLTAGHMRYGASLSGSGNSVPLLWTLGGDPGAQADAGPEICNRLLRAHA